MRFNVRTFWAPKRGSAAAEYEDAWRVGPVPRPGTTDRFTVAVADGATEASFSREWADLLTRTAVAGNGGEEHLDRSLPHLRRAWGRHVARHPLPWYASQKAEWGSAAALATLTLEPIFPHADWPLRWWSTVVGDCCVFHLRHGRPLRSLPATNSAWFGSRPCLLTTRTEALSDLGGALVSRRGLCHSGDTFVLATDALAEWAWRQIETKSQGLNTLLGLADQASFLDLVEGERLTCGSDGRPRLRNDDVTMVCVDIAR